ncbi:MAG: hypothetical protein EPO26_03520 [Chloroflexota bacterium]|nr:MAG: hypothetical protein EPO26_03520 [Chloroflexota bacterium]
MFSSSARGVSPIATPIRGFPNDRYTPYGYLGTPAHGWRLTRIGVARVEGAIRCTWYFPAYPGPYGGAWIWQATLSIDLGAPSETGDAFIVDLHTSERFRFRRGAATIDLFVEDASIVARAHAGADDAVGATATYRRQLGRSGDWDFGLYTRQVSPRAACLGAYAEGAVFCLMTDADDATWTLPPTDDAWPDRAQPVEKSIGLRGGDCRGGDRCIVLARGESASEAEAQARTRIERGATDLRRRSGRDSSFWRDAPRLEGDWPDHWRRGFVYDLETARALVRSPSGIFRTRWDGMQIQVPRFVFAETAIDMAILSLADPATAREVIEGSLRDAPAPNLPCIREDGSTNMVTSDGRARGTGPNWGWPLWCIDQIYRRAPDRAWLGRVLPNVERYLDWWFVEQTTRDGRPFFSSGWESGQDGSARFNAESGGGHIESIEPVDLAAGLAMGADQIARWRQRLGLPPGLWPTRHDRMKERLTGLWREGWFHDAQDGQPTTIRDPMHLSAALALDLTENQRSALANGLRALPGHAGYSALEWPPVALTILESALALGDAEWASDAAYHLVDRVWRAIDAPTYDGSGPLPGIAHEHWPESGEWHTEGYGWGAATALFFTRYIAGVRFTAETGNVTIAPALPRPLRQPGQTYRIANLRLAERAVDVTYAVGSDGDVAVTID